MSKKEIVRRYLLFIVSLFTTALGVAITKKAELGVSPVSSVANVLGIRFDILTMGNWLIVWNCVLIVGQIVLLRSRFQWIQLLQVPLSFLFGYFTDFGMWLVSFFEVNRYPLRIGLTVAGTIVIGFGVSLAVIADVVMNSGEAFVKAVADITHFKFGNVKIGFDVFCVLFAMILSLIFCHMTIVGTREGTLIAALLTGTAVKFFTKRIRKSVEKVLFLSA